MILCYTIINNFNLASKIKRRGGESDALDTLIQNKSPHRRDERCFSAIVFITLLFYLHKGRNL